MTSNDIICFLKENKPYLRQHFHCTEIALFGSFARNEQDEKSDIDILVDYEPNTPNLFDVECELKEYLKKHFEREIDICSRKWISLYSSHWYSKMRYMLNKVSTKSYTEFHRGNTESHSIIFKKLRETLC